MIALRLLLYDAYLSTLNMTLHNLYLKKYDPEFVDGKKKKTR